MNVSSKTTATRASEWVDTAKAAEMLCLKPATLRVALCEKGSYYGLKPKKMPSNRLLWSVAEIERLIEGVK